MEGYSRPDQLYFPRPIDQGSDVSRASETDHSGRDADEGRGSQGILEDLYILISAGTGS